MREWGGVCVRVVKQSLIYPPFNKIRMLTFLFRFLFGPLPEQQDDFNKWKKRGIR